VKTVKNPYDFEKNEEKFNDFANDFFVLDWKECREETLETMDDMLKTLGYELEVLEDDGADYFSFRPVKIKR